MGGESPSMIDQSFSTADPGAVARAGVDVVMMYLSPDPSKNVTPAKVKAYHGEGRAVLLGWEHYAQRALEGAAAGTADGREAVRQARALFAAVGYVPRGPLAIYFAVDFDAQPSQYPVIDAYLRAAAVELHAAGFLLGDYAKFGVVEHEHAAHITDADWQTYAWSGGNVSPSAVALQYLNGQTLGGASVDFDRIIRKAELGAWWPPGHPLDAPRGATTTGVFDMTQPIPKAQLDQIVEAVWSHTYAPVKGWVPRRVDYVLGEAWNQAILANDNATAASSKLDAVAKALTAPASGILARVASVQAQLDALTKTVASAVKPADLAVDAVTLAATVSAKVVDAVKALTFKAGA